MGGDALTVGGDALTVGGDALTVALDGITAGIAAAAGNATADADAGTALLNATRDAVELTSQLLGGVHVPVDVTQKLLVGAANFPTFLDRLCELVAPFPWAFLRMGLASLCILFGQILVSQYHLRYYTAWFYESKLRASTWGSRRQQPPTAARATGSAAGAAGAKRVDGVDGGSGTRLGWVRKLRRRKCDGATGAGTHAPVGAAVGGGRRVAPLMAPTMTNMMSNKVSEDGVGYAQRAEPLERFDIAVTLAGYWQQRRMCATEFGR